MIKRMFVLLIGAYISSTTTNYVLGRNQFIAIYPPEADSITIPILSTVLLLTLTIIILVPTILFGNKKLKNG